MGNMLDVAAVVVTYNRKELLKENIEALLDQTYTNLKIIIVDNHSTDGTCEYISNHINEGKVSYYDTGENIGGAGGFNYGMKKAVELGVDLVWLMDDDSIPVENALEKLIATYRSNKDVGFLASKVLWTDGSLCAMNIPRQTLTKKVNEFSEKIVPIKLSTFVSVLIPQSVIKEVGLPIKEFFIWTDDLEYTRRISKKYESYLVNDSIVVHKTKTNNGANISTDEAERIDRYRYAYRNEMYLYKREGIKGIIYVLLRTPLHIYRVLRFSKTEKKKRIEIILHGTFEGIKFKPEVESSAEDDCF